MKILHVAESIQGGTGTYLNEILPLQIAEFGVENVRVVAPRQHAGILTDVPQACLDLFERPGRRSGLVGLAATLRAQVRAFRPDVIHAHSTFAGAIVRLLRPWFPGFMPIIYCPHGWVFDVEQSALIKTAAIWIERFLSFFTQKIVAISQHEFDEAVKIGIRPQRIVLVENGIHRDIPAVVPAVWDDARLKVLFVGRLDRQKGVDVLAEAVAPHVETISVRVIGASVLKAGSTMDFPPNMELLGWRDRNDIAAQMAACDLVVMPSRWEGFGLVAVEAMRAQRAVVASAVGGLRQVVVDQVTGLTVPKEDPAALAAAILSRDADGWAVMGRAGRQHFLEFYTSDRTHRKLVDVYQQVVASTDAPFTSGSAAE